jgi:hypothetical protein
MEPGKRIQLHLALPFKLEPGKHPRIARLLAEGYRILQLQRLTDRDAIVTLERTA